MDVPRQIGALRDLVMAHALHGLILGSQTAAGAEEMHRAFGRWNQARQLAGEEAPRDGLETEWLHVSLAGVKLRVVAEQHEGAVRLYETMRDRPWVDAHVHGQWGSPFAAVYRFTKVVYHIARGEPDKVVQEAEAFQGEKANDVYIDKKHRMAELARYVQAENQRFELLCATIR